MRVHRGASPDQGVRKTPNLCILEGVAVSTKPKATPPERDTSTWLTREQASDLLGVSIQSLRNWETRGYLTVGKKRSAHYQRDVTVYDPDELARMPRRLYKMASPKLDAGEIDARVFQLLDAGKCLREIVVEVRIPYAQAEHLREQWLDAGGYEIKIAPAIKAELERLFGAFETPGDLCRLARAKIEALAGQRAANDGGV